MSPFPHLLFTNDDVLLGFGSLPIIKALAPLCTPALIYRALEYHSYGEVIDPPTDWMAAWLHLIPKTGKPSIKPVALRPICLQRPIIKIILEILTQQIKYHAYPIFRYLPLYIYLPHRGAIE